MRVTFEQGDKFPEHWSQSQRAEMLQYLVQLLAQKVILAYGQPSQAGGPPVVGFRPTVPEVQVDTPNIMHQR